ncbi:FtsB family cell division protein [Gulosibacter macacae]|nr:septum formation initiator family protein [Gulosibacter macacae]
MTSTKQPGNSRRAGRRPTGGSLLLIGVLIIGVGMLTPTVNQLISQQQRIRDLEADIATASADLDQLTTEKARWDDPAYVRAQARGRLLFVEPGDTSYFVVDSGGQRAPLAPVDVSVDMHETKSDPAALYLESLIRAANADSAPTSQETP